MSGEFGSHVGDEWLQEVGIFTIIMENNKLELSINDQDKLELVNKLYPESMALISTAWQVKIEKEINHVGLMKADGEAFFFFVTTLRELISKQPFHLQQMLLNKI